MLSNAVVIGGLGVIGTATRDFFGIEHYIDHKGQTLTYAETRGYKYIFICLPTPATEVGYNIESIFSVLKELKKYERPGRLYILRSTVLPGTTDSLIQRLGMTNIVHNPEFLTMSTIKDDMKHPDIVVAGSIRKSWAEEVLELYKQVLDDSIVQYIATGTKESEMIKLGTNLLYATKVVIANQIYDVCKDLGVEYEIVRKALYQRKWIGSNHLDIWHNGKRGAGGMCLKKDLDAWTNRFGQPIFKEIQRVNDQLLEMKQ